MTDFFPVFLRVYEEGHSEIIDRRPLYRSTRAIPGLSAYNQRRAVLKAYAREEKQKASIASREATKPSNWKPTTLRAHPPVQY